MNRIEHSFGWRLVIVLAITMSVVLSSLPQQASAVTYMYGRREWESYFRGGFSVGVAHRACPGQTEGQMICGGLRNPNGTEVSNLSQFIDFYSTHLNNASTADNRSSAFTILVMLGVTGPNAGGSGNAGVAMARSRFAEWSALVTAYDKAGRANYNHTSFTFTTNTFYRSGTEQDVQWKNITDTHTAVTFRVLDGSYVAIKKHALIWLVPTQV